VTEAFLAANPGPGASVVNISAVSGSVTGGTGNDPPGFGWYAAAKAGILGYTRWCATELATTCRFNAIAPGGPIETPRNRAFLDSPGMAERIRRNPMRRPGTAAELAAGILFLWSPAASYVNGALLVIDGGLTLTGG
jgi:3-oxoacyl-[acyl-carrier protein] reductase